jgi:superfamily I DNA and/or RNA helicase
VCAFTSEAFYEGRLTGIDGLELQEVLGAGDLVGTGLRFVGVAHEGNTNDSVEEAEIVARIVNEILARTWRDSSGVERPVTVEDVLVVTPYNAQIREIQQAFRRHGIDPIRVGTVDKFQGRQGTAVIYSMATSLVDEAPRGTEFLFDLHRLNVATSRARCLAIVLASPELLRVMCRTPRQMELVNALCRFREMSAG